MIVIIILLHGEVTQPIPMEGGAKEFCGNQTVRPCPKVWIRDQRWTKYYERWGAGKVQMQDNPQGLCYIGLGVLVTHIIVIGNITKEKVLKGRFTFVCS